MLLFFLFILIATAGAFAQVNQVKEKFGQNDYSTGELNEKKDSYSNLFTFAMNILWDEAKRRLNLGEINVKKELQSDSTETYLFNINNRRLKISGKMPKQPKK